MGTNPANRFIPRSSSPAALPISFFKKKNGSLRLCVDYCALKQASVKNRYLLRLISENLERVGKVKIFTKLDLGSAYNRIPIKEGNELKMAFWTRYGQFKYQVMPFGLTIMRATFQAYMDDYLRPYMDEYVVYYLHNIPIYSKDVTQHKNHMRKMLEILCVHGVTSVAGVRLVIT
jgi:hypothetical protein